MSIDTFEWTTHAEAFARVSEFLANVAARNPFLKRLGSAMRAGTGTRLIDWVDRIGCRDPRELESVGYVRRTLGSETVWQHPEAILPTVVEADQDLVAIRTESVARFLLAHGLDERTEICGEPRDEVRRATVSTEGVSRIIAVERHGTQRWNPGPTGSRAALMRHSERLLLRRREFDDPIAGFAYTEQLFREATNDIGTNRACDLFFSAERAYWQHRNRAARVQKLRQDRLGLGWANHDHHTYRSSRQAFPHLVRNLELMGFQCRERFYAGAEAGWGAQVLEQPDCRIVIFADVDLAPGEVANDFAHGELPPQDELGTVGLWCALHGEAFLQAGMHHLECQFDFDLAREQLAGEGVESMAPFTDFEYLRQAFTVGERWPVAEARLQTLLAAGQISEEDADRFRKHGALGSHLEILERNDGYKGFNKTGISEIILQTNPRTAQ